MPVTFEVYFDQIYVINLVERVDRLQETIAQFEKVGVRMPNSRVKLFPAVRPEESGEFCSVGARGCFESHLGVLQDAVDRNYQRILICEDDLNFAVNFTSRFPAVISQLSGADWSIYYGSCRLMSSTELNLKRGFLPIPPAQEIQTAHFVGFHGATIPTVHNYLRMMLTRRAGDPLGGPMHVDGAYNWFRKDNPGFKTFASFPVLGYQRPSRSDIKPLRWYDRIPLISAGVTLARTQKARLKQLVR